MEVSQRSIAGMGGCVSLTGLPCPRKGVTHRKRYPFRGRENVFIMIGINFSLGIPNIWTIILLPVKIYDIGVMTEVARLLWCATKYNSRLARNLLLIFVEFSVFDLTLIRSCFLIYESSQKILSLCPRHFMTGGLFSRLFKSPDSLI